MRWLKDYICTLKIYENCLHLFAGMGKRYPHPDRSSISTGFRNSEMVILCFANKDTPITKKEHHDFANNYIYTMGEGIHPNEAAFDLVNWQIESWGSFENYQRLLDVKHRYDPEQFFKCDFCVGSEEQSREFTPVEMYWANQQYYLNLLLN